MGRKLQELVIKRLEHLENSELGCRLEGLAVAAKTQGVKTHQLLFSLPLSECASLLLARWHQKQADLWDTPPAQGRA